MLKIITMQINQYIIVTNDSIYFQSYNSLIAKIDMKDINHKLYLTNLWNYSITTWKYLRHFLEIHEWHGRCEYLKNETKKTIKEMLFKGKIGIFEG